MQEMKKYVQITVKSNERNYLKYSREIKRNIHSKVIKTLKNENAKNDLRQHDNILYQHEITKTYQTFDYTMYCTVLYCTVLYYTLRDNTVL